MTILLRNTNLVSRRHKKSSYYFCKLDLAFSFSLWNERHKTWRYPLRFTGYTLILPGELCFWGFSEHHKPEKVGTVINYQPSSFFPNKPIVCSFQQCFETCI